MPKVYYNDPDMDNVEDPVYVTICCDEVPCFLYDSDLANCVRICELQNGERVEVLKEGHEMYKVSTSYGIVGYVYRDYLCES